MKFFSLLLLLTSVLCKAQQYKNYTKVTAYRLVSQDEDGSCLITDYMERERRTGEYIQALESFNDTLAYNLVRLKNDSEGWERIEWACDSLNRDSSVGNMFIVEINGHKDTLYTTLDNHSLFTLKEKRQYIDPSDNIRTALTNDITEFQDYNYAQEISLWKPDSIPPGTILIGGKPVYGLSRKDFEKNIAYFQVSRNDSIFDPDGKYVKTVSEYWLNNIKFTTNFMNKLDQIVVLRSAYRFAEKETLTVDGIRVGDPEKMLYEKYPCSTYFQNWGAPLNNLNNFYFYEVNLYNFAGKVIFTVRDKIIHEIQIDFRYPWPSKKK